MEVIALKTQTTTANIYIGEDAIETRLPALTQGRENFVLTDSNVYALYKNWLDTYFPNTPIFVLKAGEENKTFSSLCEILQAMVNANLHRTAQLFAVGGGVIGDIGGLAASLYMRGISCVQIPTTLLAQVDSSVGGKTAVDLNGVKNIVGAFYQPTEVLVSPTFLQTLPAREIKCGLGEIIKYCALSKEILKCVEKAEKLDNLSFLQTLIKDCIAYKAGVVTRDEKETGERKCLNVGHTTGHSIELSTGLSHGESVLYGMLWETRVAMRNGICEKEYGARLLAVIEKTLQVAPISNLYIDDMPTALQKAKADKKNTGDGRIQMAVACSLGQWTTMSLSFERYVQEMVWAQKQ